MLSGCVIPSGRSIYRSCGYRLSLFSPSVTGGTFNLLFILFWRLFFYRTFCFIIRPSATNFGYKFTQDTSRFSRFSRRLPPMPDHAFGAGPYGKKRPASNCACMDGQHSFGCGYTQHVDNASFIDVSAPSFGSGPPLP